MSPISSRNSVPPSACSNRPRRSACAPVNDAALVAEELGLEQILRDRRGVDRDERLGGARAVPMQCARDQFLAGARFAGDEHRGVGLRQPADRTKNFLHRRGLPQHLGVGRAASAARQRVGVSRARPADQRQRLVDIERLGQVLERAALERGDRTVEVGIRGHDDHRDLRMLRLDLGEQLDARPAWHSDVTHHHQRFGLRRARAASRRRAGERSIRDAFAGERLFQHPADRAVVIDYPYSLHAIAARRLVVVGVHGAFFPFSRRDSGRISSGNKMVKLVRPGSLSHSIAPWCCATKVWAIVSPSPLPPSRPGHQREEYFLPHGGGIPGPLSTTEIASASR